MILRSSIQVAAGLILIGLISSGCERDTAGLKPVPLDVNPEVFADGLVGGADFQAFLGSKLDAVSIDSSERYEGAASLKVTVPAPGDPTGTYAGGALTAGIARDLSEYNALTFWAKASMAAQFNEVGLANDNTGTSKYTVSMGPIPLTTTWTKFTIPIPATGKLVNERGLFYFAEAAENGQGYSVWFDDIKFETVGNIALPRGRIDAKTVEAFVGGTVTPTGARTTFTVSGADRTVNHSPWYFSFFSSNESVARIGDDVIEIVGGGNATITAKLGSVDVTGTVTLNVIPSPAEPAPTPTLAAGNVIALFSDAYSEVPVDTWSAQWDVADVSDFEINGNETKAYTNLAFAGIEFVSSPVNATSMTHFHIDVWAGQGTNFKVKLVNFTSTGSLQSESELTFSPVSTPAFTTGSWLSLDIPLSNFTGLTGRDRVSQLIISGNVGTVYVDNIYFHK